MIQLAKSDPPKQVAYDDFVNMNASSCSCSNLTSGCKDDFHFEQTLVTMLVAIDRPGKSWGHYMRNFKRLMAWFPHTPMIAFVEKGYGEELAAAHPHANGSKEAP